MTSAPSVPSVPFDDLTEHFGRVVEALTRGVPRLVTYRDRTIATIRRLGPFKEDLTGWEVLDTVTLRRATRDRAVALQEGGRFAVGRFGRAEAVIEGVKP